MRGLRLEQTRQQVNAPRPHQTSDLDVKKKIYTAYLRADYALDAACGLHNLSIANLFQKDRGMPNKIPIGKEA
jgi:hypothetical protein